MGLSDGRKSFPIGLAVLIQYWSVSATQPPSHVAVVIMLNAKASSLKIIKIFATRCRILRLKCTKFDFGWGSAQDPAGGANFAPSDPLAGLRGPTSKGRGGEGGGRDKVGRGREGRGGEGREVGEKGRGRSSPQC